MEKALNPTASILAREWRRHPAMQAQDIYKLLHQAALGSEHAVLDEDAARLRLAGELAEMTEMSAGLDDPLIEPISPDGRIVRIHLRPWCLAGYAPEVLLTAFLRTAKEWRGSTVSLAGSLQAAVLALPGEESTSRGQAAVLALSGIESSSRGQAAILALPDDQSAVRRQDLEAFFADMERQGFPAVHHSPEYVRLYRPAYRVAAKEFLEVP